MKILKVTANSRRREFSIITRSGAEYSFPCSKADVPLSADDPIQHLFVDRELGNEAFTYILKSGKQGSIHIEQVLEYNEDPKYLADLLTYKLSIEAMKGLESSSLSRRQIAERLNTSVPQLYRLLDPLSFFVRWHCPCRSAFRTGMTGIGRLAVVPHMVILVV